MPALRTLLSHLFSDDLDANSDTFFAVWGVAIALAIFLIEISGSFHCGIRLKRITRWHWGIKSICRGAVEYLLLGPLAYFSSAWEWRVTSFGCVMAAFAGMGYMLAFFQCYLHIDVIQDLVVDKTVEKIERWNTKKQTVTHSEIDELPIIEMLEYADYKQEYELRIMADTLSRVTRESRKWVRDTVLENTLLMTWIKHVVLHSGMASEAEKECTQNLLNSIWKGVTQECEPQSCLTYSVQILIPFMDIGGKDANNMLIRAWKNLNLYSQTNVIYLLLYTEFRYWFVDGRVHEWIWTDDQTMRYEFGKIREGEFGWDKWTAWQYWLDWSQYNRPRGDIGLGQFENFCRHVDALKGSGTAPVRVSVLSCL